MGRFWYNRTIATLNVFLVLFVFLSVYIFYELIKTDSFVWQGSHIHANWSASQVENTALRYMDVLGSYFHSRKTDHMAQKVQNHFDMFVASYRSFVDSELTKNIIHHQDIKEPLETIKNYIHNASPFIDTLKDHSIHKLVGHLRRDFTNLKKSLRGLCVETMQHNMIYMKQRAMIHKSFISSFAIFYMAVLLGGGILLYLYFNEMRKAIKSSLEAADANASKSKFLATMSHELRTPLNAINGFSEMLLSPDRCAYIKPEKIAEYAQYINKSGTHLLHIVNGILDFSRVEMDKLRVEKEHVDVKELIHDIKKILSLSIKQKKIRIKISVTDGIVVGADRKLLQQILYNLVNNAIKYNVLNGSIDITAAISTQNELVIGVKDSGIGISKKNLKRVFLPFERVDDPYSQNESGTGLGLPFVKAAVDAHKGKILVSSKIDKGSIFTIILPDACIVHDVNDIVQKSAA